MLDIAVMHLARLGGETVADIVGVLDDVVAQFLQFGAQLALLRHHQRRGFGWRRRRLLGGHGSGAFAPLLADDLRPHDRLPDLRGAAGRAGHELAADLRIVSRRTLEPAFESMALFAAQVVADHAEPRTRCRCSGPALGSATVKRRPCCSEGTALRAVSTLAGS